MAADIETHPKWRALRRTLAGLTISANCSNAFVLDAWGNLWCSAASAKRESLDSIVSTTESALRALKPPLPRGGKLDRVVRLHLDAYLRSFGGAYVLFLLFPDSFDVHQIRPIVTAELPAIASLTAALPPPEGPGSAGSEGFGIA
jgi:hypothetical protein